MAIGKQEDFLIIMKEHVPIIKNRWLFFGVAIGFLFCLILGLVAFMLVVDFTYFLFILVIGSIMFSIISIYYYMRLMREADQFTEYEE